MKDCGRKVSGEQQEAEVVQRKTEQKKSGANADENGFLSGLAADEKKSCKRNNSIFFLSKETSESCNRNRFVHGLLEKIADRGKTNLLLLSELNKSWIRFTVNGSRKKV